MNLSSRQSRRALSEPHGGKLIDRLIPASATDAKLREADEMQKLRPFDDFLYDAEKIGTGAYSPLEGFMNEETLSSVITESKLPNGLPWTMPIILAPKEDGDTRSLKEGDDLALVDWKDSPFGILHVDEKFSYSKQAFATSVYRTTDMKHPNVNDIFQNYGSIAVAGKVTLLRKLRLPGGREDPSPAEIRQAFVDKGWRNVVAYQCRNPPHTAHEYIQRCALENADIDGLFIHPVVGRLKLGDYKPEIILEAYKAAVDRYYPKERVLLAPLSISMRYAGPKAALFLAIVRKNYGATHYIVGRDQAGVGNYYQPYDCHRIFDNNDIGIVPLRYTETFYCRMCGWMATEKTCPHPAEERVSISQTRLRQILNEGKQLPAEIVRPEVANILSRPDVLLTYQ